MRALFFETDDERLWQFPDQYLLGDDLLVAPVTEPGATAKIVLVPAGEWLDGWRGTGVRGPTVLEVDAPLGYPPVFIRRGAASSLRAIFRGG
jgi:alpha-glucosidase (family GH31 glycosyl hydrolase)